MSPSLKDSNSCIQAVEQKIRDCTFIFSQQGHTNQNTDLPFPSNNQLVHSNCTGCWIKAVCCLQCAHTSVKELCVGAIASELLLHSSQKCLSSFPHMFYFSVLQKAMQHRAHSPDPTWMDVKHCQMHLPWWNQVNMFMANLKVSCLDWGFWERGSSLFLLGTALVNFLQLSRLSEKDSQDYKDHVSMVILIRNLTCSRIDRSKKQNQASRMIYFSSSPRK